MEGVFIFEDVAKTEDHVIRQILSSVTIDDLTKALIREDENIRKLFYQNMSLNDLKELDEKLKITDDFTRYDKKQAQKKILDIISNVPEYENTRFEHGFSDIEEFETYLLERHQPEGQYGIFEKEPTTCRFFESKNGDKFLEDIRMKNESENMGNIKIPNTNIQLINYSVCPKCNHVYSFNDISHYYLNPRPDPAFQNKKQQYREDTRVYCDECKTYFLPALIIVDGTPKNEVQFLCRIQTMNAIEDYYGRKKIKVLSRSEGNIVKKESNEKTTKYDSTSFSAQLFGARAVKVNKIIEGIKNDVLLKEMESKPTLISNLIQYTPANIVLNLVEGTNVRNGDLLFGNLS
jgi:transcription antitermination factor NusA-like protein